MMRILKKFFIAALLVAGFGLSSAPQAKAQQAPSRQQIDGMLDALKSLPPDQRDKMLNEAMDSFKGMPPEQRQKIIKEAKARAQNLSDSQKSRYENQWEQMLTPEQKKNILDQLKKEGITKETLQQKTPAAPAQNSATPQQAGASPILQQVQNLTPEQRQKLLHALIGLDASGQ